MHYKADTAWRRPIFSVGVYTLEGTFLAGPNTREVGLVPDYIEGEGYVDFEVPHLPLLAGVYDLTVAIYDYSHQHPYDHRHQALRFNVEAGDPHLVHGLISMNAQWSLKD